MDPGNATAGRVELIRELKWCYYRMSDSNHRTAFSNKMMALSNKYSLGAMMCMGILSLSRYAKFCRARLGYRCGILFVKVSGRRSLKAYYILPSVFSK